MASTADIRREIEGLFKYPLKADVNKIRIIVNYTALPSKRLATHARLPNCPKINTDTRKPLKIKEVQSALKEMEKWSKRTRYDSYFCAGEMAAAFCELLDVIEPRLSSSSPDETINIMACCVDWYYRQFSQIVDGSDGIWIFPITRIGKIVAQLKCNYPSHSAWSEFNEVVEDAGTWWGEGPLDVEVIAGWKDGHF